mmetsp:Transcript_7408/g.10829  ORF Transcript_7408/g.10829 Transcript_7408/m.10829 type:complete len:796 (+) Transcript_7408:55-2442(+)|eukprot:CAMPEP_0197239760 /NCGR_PEP_ID=MMETSP1429-20130617/6193_1 /TAXON_ID=49237 /ORGANISM="Chaetoceros  sp., Strain UNC1202" /LENGTH=795 /DNA_ID=CAMNT_0042699253 /DNA_START=41 /DNA_END=2428 /DNA_ORIENTATION=+
MTSPQTGKPPKRAAIDIRIFLTVITVAMACAFSIGVAIGPSPQIIPTDFTSSSGSIGTIEADADGASSEEKVKATRRSKTKHSSEIGKKIINSDLNERHVNFQQPSLEDFGDGAGAVKYDATTVGNGDEEHLPAGQHLLVDLMNVEAAFLNSERRLSDAIVESVRGAGLTLLSYHCHSLIPAGVSCVGVLLESHISFHTWPDEGVITLDLFTCGPKPLLPVVKDLERLFGIPRVKDGKQQEVVSQWSHELRGFRNSDAGNSYLDNKSDLATWVISPLLFGTKTQVASANSKYQRIDIWDFLAKDSTPSYEDALAAGLEPGDPRWMTSEIATADRYLFLDGNIQSMKDSEREFHETLVHPAMFAHSNPKHIAIVGGGEGATIRELLKHETVETITMVEIDREMVEIAMEHLPYMSDCSDIEGAAELCFDDERVTVIYEDASKWFKDNYPTGASPDRQFDVVILDTLDPKQGSPMYSDSAFLDALYGSMSDDGVFALHVGQPHTIHDPKPDMGVFAPREQFFQLLEAHPATAAMFVYEEAHCGYEEPHAFLTVCKSSSCRSKWYAEPAVVDDEIYERIKRTKSEKASLIHYDGATHHSFQIPPRAWETVYCRREPMPFECAYRGLDLTKELFEMPDEDEEEPGSFEIRELDVDGTKSNTIFATVDIPEGSYIMPSDVAASMVIGDEIIEGLESNANVKSTGEVTVIDNFLKFINENGHASMAEGIKLNYVEVGATTFIRRSENASEINVGRWMPPHPSGKNPVFSPVYDRHLMAFDVFIVATRDIKAGEEIVKPSNL